jgi:hypothetical protein
MAYYGLDEADGESPKSVEYRRVYLFNFMPFLLLSCDATPSSYHIISAMQRLSNPCQVLVQVVQNTRPIPL